MKALYSKDPRPVLLVDDFVGSGQQTTICWHRQYSTGPVSGGSFSTAPAHREGVYYIPPITTHDGLVKITADCPGLTMLPAHVLGEDYSLTSPKCRLWPDGLKADASRFLKDVSQRAGIVDELGPNWDGFGNLALPLAFYHCVPDATLPLYYWDRNGWTPLVRMR